MSRLKEFANAKNANGEKGLKAFVSGVKAAANKAVNNVKQAYPAIKKKIGKVAMEVAPYAAAILAGVGMGLAGDAVGVDLATNMAGSGGAAFMAGAITEVYMNHKRSRG